MLQIFLEKIIECIGQIAYKIKKVSRNELKLWREKTTFIRKTVANTLQRSSSADSSLLITTTTHNQGDLSYKNRLTRHQIEESVEVSIKFKPLLKNIEPYMKLIQEIQNQYIYIMKTCAPQVSKHFTNMTSVIVEGNSYEFPSNELHKAIISKLILNDKLHF